MEISIVIPLLNEAESLPELEQWIRKVLEPLPLRYEIIFIDDGSTDESWEVVRSLQQRDSRVKGIRLQRNYGKSAALNEGFKAAQGEVVITMDADLQDSPNEIPELYRMIREDGFDLVSGWKKIRHDNKLTKNLPSRFYNATTRRLSKINLHDFNCGLKAYRNKVVKSVEVYGDMHRYIPVLAKWSGFKKIGEKVVEHRARKYGHTKFGLSRFVYGPLDLMSIMFVGKYGKRPMHFFGLWGILFFTFGFALVLWLVVSKLIDTAYSLTDRPSFYIALTILIIGSQLFLAGFIGELISRNSPGRNAYLIEEKLGI